MQLEIRGLGLLMVVGAIAGCSGPPRTSEIGLVQQQLAGSGGIGALAGQPARAGGGGAGMVALPPRAPELLFASVPLPANGVLQISHDADSIGPTVEMSTASGERIAGDVEHIESHWIWRPAAPLAPGSYTVVLSTSLGGMGSHTIVVEGTHAPVPPQLSSEPTATLISELTEQLCCMDWNEWGLRQEGTCFGVEQTNSIMLEPKLASPEPLQVLGQFLFRVRPTSSEGASESNESMLVSWGTDTRLRFVVQADEYCFSVEALDLVTLETHMLDDLSPRCAAHGEFGQVGATEIEPTLSQLDPLICHTPPTEYEDVWCVNVDAACARVPEAPGCMFIGFVCRNEPYTGHGELPPNEDPEEDTNGDASESSSPKHYGRPGCSVTVGSHSTRAGALGVLIALLLLCWRGARLGIPR